MYLREINEDVIYKVEKSLKAEIYDFIKNLPDGINTNVAMRCKIFWWSETKNWGKSIIQRS